MKPSYEVRRALAPLAVTEGWAAEARAGAELSRVEHFREESSAHRPSTQFKLQWDADALHGIFRVEDRHVLAVQTEFNSQVCTDSCVEFFVQPEGGRGYCNFEFNCCGVLLASHIEDETRGKGGFGRWRRWTEAEGRQVEIVASLAGPIPEERVGDCVWTLAFRIPLAPLLACTGAPAPRPGAVWRANLYKCGDKTSHPHWGAWSPVDALNFHLPRCFGFLRFI
jgi:hypothetical protein